MESLLGIFIIILVCGIAFLIYQNRRIVVLQKLICLMRIFCETKPFAFPHESDFIRHSGDMPYLVIFDDVQNVKKLLSEKGRFCNSHYDNLISELSGFDYNLGIKQSYESLSKIDSSLKHVLDAAKGSYRYNLKSELRYALAVSAWSDLKDFNSKKTEQDDWSETVFLYNLIDKIPHQSPYRILLLHVISELRKPSEYLEIDEFTLDDLSEWREYRRNGDIDISILFLSEKRIERILYNQKIRRERTL